MRGGAFLIADIGATNARFALLNDPSSVVAGQPSVTLPTADYRTTRALLESVRAALSIEALDAACLAVAGAVTDGRASITNGILSLDAGEIGDVLGCRVELVNDFAALAHGVPRLTEVRWTGGVLHAEGVTVVIGPGSGLGMSARVPLGTGAVVLASEGGHGNLAPGNALEQELLVLLSREHDPVTWETVLSGPGLVNLYRAMAQLWGAQPEPATPEWVSEQGSDAGDPICHQTLETFFGLLGSAAGNVALIMGARGGVYVGGGIVPKLVEFAASSPMRRRFDERGALSDYVAGIPVGIIMDAQPGLTGAAECLRLTLES